MHNSFIKQEMVEDAPLSSSFSTGHSSDWPFPFLPKKWRVVFIQFAFKRTTSYQELRDCVEIEVNVPLVMWQADTRASPWRLTPKLIFE